MTLKRIIAIVSLILAFALIDLAVYNVFTKKYIDNSSSEMKARSVEVSEFLPFDDNSGIVKCDHVPKIAENIPVLDGAAALFPVYSAFANAIYPKDSVKYDGTDFTDGSAVRFTNTRGAYKAIVDGDADVVFCAKPSKEQLAYASEKGVELKLVPIGYEAFVFIVNKDNPVNDLTVEQVRGIYSGSIKKWSEVGGDDTYIDALQRNTGSGSQTSMLAFMGDTPMRRSLLGAISGRAIGFSFRYYVEGLVGNGSIKMLSLNGVYPDKENIASGKYPVSSNFYAVYSASNDNPNIQTLIDFILSEDGQRIVKESGYVPLS